MSSITTHDGITITVEVVDRGGFTGATAVIVEGDKAGRFADFFVSEWNAIDWATSVTVAYFGWHYNDALATVLGLAKTVHPRLMVAK